MKANSKSNYNYLGEAFIDFEYKLSPAPSVGFVDRAPRDAQVVVHFHAGHSRNGLQFHFAAFLADISGSFPY